MSEEAKQDIPELPKVELSEEAKKDIELSIAAVMQTVCFELSSMLSVASATVKNRIIEAAAKQQEGKDDQD